MPVPELAEFVLDLDDLDDDQPAEVGRAVLRAIAPSASRFQVDLPGGRDDLPQDAVRAAEVLRVAAGKTSKEDREYAVSDRLTPWVEVQTERRAARRAWVRSHPLSALGWVVAAAGLLLVPLPGPGVPVVLAGIVLVVVGSVLARLRRKGHPDRPQPSAPDGSCPDCGHPWSEHAGSGNDRKGMCGECVYEFEHHYRQTDAPGCRRPVPGSDRS